MTRASGFTSKERDPESSLDSFGARYYSPFQGRFTSTDPDPVTEENFVNPQRWNLYIYVNNNPLASRDPNGGDGQGKGGDKQISVFIDQAVSADRNTSSNGSPEGDPGWNRLGGNGYTVNVTYTNMDLSNPAAQFTDVSGKVLDALKTLDVVVFVSHGVGTDGPNGAFQQTNIQIAMSISTRPILRFIHRKWMATHGRSCKAERLASAPQLLAASVCDSVSATSTYLNFVGSDQHLVTVDSGKNGVTASGTLEKAAYGFVNALYSEQWRR